MGTLHNVAKGSVNKVNKHLGNISRDKMMEFGATAGFEILAGTHQGEGFGASLTKGIAVGFAEQIIGPFAFGAIQTAALAPSLVKGYMRLDDNLRSKRNTRLDSSNMNFSYEDTRAAYTMRQSAVQAIQGSKLNARSALGGEARLMHR